MYAGTLTSVGMQQVYELGTVLKDEYINRLKFLSSSYKAEEL